MNAMCAAPPRLFTSNVDAADKVWDIHEYAARALEVPSLPLAEQIGWLKESIRRIQDMAGDLAERLDEVDRVDEPTCTACHGTGCSRSGRRLDDGADALCECCHGSGISVEA